MRVVYEIRRYLTATGRDRFGEWLDGLRDLKAQGAIVRRIARMGYGNFGDHKSCGEGVFELRMMLGPGYRVYFARDGERLVLLLFGGEKSRQQEDIRAAKAYWKDWKERSDERQES